MGGSSRVWNVLGLIAVALFLAGPILAALRLVPPMVGFLPFTIGGLLAVVVAIAAGVRAMRGLRVGRGGALATTLAALLFVWTATRGVGAPLINDYCTDPADPPRFTQAARDADNAGRDLSYPASFADTQRGCCPDLAPVRLPLDPAAAFTAVDAAAGAMPDWTITRRDPQAGELEAVSTSTVFGFADDVVVRVRADPAGGSRIDMRSKSRLGKGDRGVNAARIRAFQAKLAAARG